MLSLAWIHSMLPLQEKRCSVEFLMASFCPCCLWLFYSLHLRKVQEVFQTYYSYQTLSDIHFSLSPPQLLYHQFSASHSQDAHLGVSFLLIKTRWLIEVDLALCLSFDYQLVETLCCVLACFNQHLELLIREALKTSSCFIDRDHTIACLAHSLTFLLVFKM